MLNKKINIYTDSLQKKPKLQKQKQIQYLHTKKQKKQKEKLTVGRLHLTLVGTN